MLSLILWSPLVAALLMALVPAGNERAVRVSALSLSLVHILLVALVLMGFHPSAPPTSPRCRHPSSRRCSGGPGGSAARLRGAVW